jgi:hypothetical protein
MGIGTVLYNACLALYSVGHSIRVEERYIAKRVEPWTFVAVGFALVLVSPAAELEPLGLDIFALLRAFQCFTQSYEDKGPTNCIRGDNARIYK